MGLTKSEIFTAEQNRVAAIAKVLGHPARVAILQYLLRVQHCICGDLVEEIGLAQATISQHLREMKNIGLLKGDIDGTKVCYCIDAAVFKEIGVIFEELFKADVKDCKERPVLKKETEQLNNFII